MVFSSIFLTLTKKFNFTRQILQVRKQISYYDIGKTTLRCIFSHFGLFLLLVLYTLFGAWLFRLCEYDELLQSNVKVNQKTAEIDSITQKLGVRFKQMAVIGAGNLNVTKATIKQWLDDYHSTLRDAIQNDGYTGSTVDQPGSNWNMASAMLFALTLITTVGYGHVTPATEFGRFLIIPYSLLGIPLLLIFLTDHGFAIGGLLRNSFHKLCCYGPRRTRDKNIEAVRLAHQLKGIQNEKKMQQEVIKQMSEPHPIHGDDEHVPVAFLLAHRLNGIQNEKKIQQEVIKQMSKPHPIHGDDEHVPVTLLFFLVIFYAVLGSVMFWKSEGWTFINSLYFCFVTLLTIGFGDFVPGYIKVDTTAGCVRLLAACLYIVVGLAILTMSVSLIVDELFNRAKKVAAKIRFLKEEEELEGIDVYD